MTEVAPSPYSQNGGPVTVALVALEAKRVDDLLAAERDRQDDARAASQLAVAVAARVADARHDSENEHRRELDSAESKRIDANAVAEQRRVDAVIASDRAAVLLANTEARLTALALAERVETAATTLAAAAGIKEQASTGRTQNQWTVERVMAVIVIVLGAFYFILTYAPRPGG